MNLTIAKEQILSGLQAVQNVVSTRTTLPVLSNVNHDPQITSRAWT